MTKPCYTYDAATKRLTPAPKVVRVNIYGKTYTFANPLPWQYAAAGAFPLAEVQPDPPEVPDGKVAVPDGYDLVKNEWVRKWRIEDAPPPRPRRFSKLKIVAALTTAGVWPDVKQYVEQAGLYDLFLAAQDFAEDNEYFATGKTALQTALGWTDEQVEAVLAASVE